MIDNSSASGESKTTRNAILVGVIVLALGVSAWSLWGGRSEPPVDTKAAETAARLKDSYGPEKPPPQPEGTAPPGPTTRGARKVQ